MYVATGEREQGMMGGGGTVEGSAVGKESSDSPLGSSSRSMNHRGLDEIDNANTLVSADSLLRLFFFTFAIHAEV